MKSDIPIYRLEDFRKVHRHEHVTSTFGYNQIDKDKMIRGFELYSSEGLVGSVGPLKSDFFRMSITVRGTLDMTIGLEHYKHQPRTVSFTYPNQIFFKNNISPDAFGYYILFQSDFLDGIIPSVKLAEEFPFFDISMSPLFQLSEEELDRVIDLVLKMDEELQQGKVGKDQAIQMYLYLVLLEAKRSFERQPLHKVGDFSEKHHLAARFRRLVGMNYQSKRQVADYAYMLSVSPNHLNRVVKEVTGETASHSIREMLAQEAKSLLRYTDNSVAEIAYRLEFSDPASFNRFFKSMTDETPLNYRGRHN